MEIYHDLYGLLNIDLIRSANLTAHEKNISNFFSRPDVHQEVISGICLIPPRSKWFFESDKFYCLNETYVSPNFKDELSDFLQISKKLTSVLDNKNIAVELSGGLDTSIIIGIIKYLGFDPFLIGMRSSRYELRTEAFIQDKYADEFKNVCLLDSDETLPYTNLKSTPLHQYPSSSSLYYMHALKIASECKKNGVDIIFSGMGFDSLLCDDVTKFQKNTIPANWHTWMLDDNWFRENIYSKFNISYSSAVASQILIKSLSVLRMSEGEDLKKRWARKTFKKFLPTELSHYAYKADNSGGYLDGFLNAREDLTDIYKVAYEITKMREFKESELDSLYMNSHLLDEIKDKLILSRVSFANWIYALSRENMI